jgi:predicted XRE-type DNA-binding protein
MHLGNNMKKKHSHINWPSEKELARVRKKLLRPDAIGSSMLSPNASLSDRVKFTLCEQIVKFKLATGISQKELAKVIKINETEMSRVLHYKIDRYTIERLMGYVEIINPTLRVEVSVA